MPKLIGPGPSCVYCGEDYGGHADDCPRVVPDPAAGLHQKYVVSRTDGSSEPGGKHAGCEYFVLDLSHDPFAYAAIVAYAGKCAVSHPKLSDDLLEKAHQMGKWMVRKQFAEMSPKERKYWADSAYNDPERR